VTVLKRLVATLLLLQMAYLAFQEAHQQRDRHSVHACVLTYSYLYIVRDLSSFTEV
jgi:hypothetical protein